MANVVSYVNAFTAGEIGPDAWERTDLEQHAKGCDEALNMIGLVTGPLASRGGFLDRGAVHDETRPSRAFGFSRATGDALFLELGHYTMRVWTPEGDPILSGGVPYVFATPWSADEVQQLWLKQINDVIYVTARTAIPPRVLIYQAPDNWAWSGFAFADGPWLVENVTGPTLTASPAGIPTTLTSDTNVFTPQDVGGLLQYREGDGYPGHDTWTASTEYPGDKVVQFDGRVYGRAGGATGKSGTTPPLHESGIMSDGKIDWTFLHDGRGVCLVTGYVSPTEVTVTCLRPGPISVGTTRYWSFGAYSDRQGWPSALVCDRDERLIVASSQTRPGMVDMTRSFGFGRNFGDFKPGLGTGRVVDDDAVRIDVGGTEKVHWVASAGVLIAGCSDGEYVLSGSTLDEGISPLSRHGRSVSKFGNAAVEPLMIQGPPVALLHVLASGKTIRDTRFSADLSVESFDRSLMAHHIHERGIVEMAWQQPDNIVWLRLADGGLAAMTYHMEHGVYGTTRMGLPPGWTCESIATARAAGGDLLMIVASRVKAGITQRRMWRLARRSEQVFVDTAGIYEGPPETVIGGLDHLDGEIVQIVADGAQAGDQTVTAGTITLASPASRVVVGTGMLRRFRTLSLDLEGPGSTNARTIVPTHCTVILTAVDALVGTDLPDSSERVQQRTPDDLAAPVLRRLRARVGLGGGAGSDRDRRVVVQNGEPFDLVIHAYRLEAEVTK